MESYFIKLEKCTGSISNPEEVINQAISLSSNLSMVWRSSDTGAKEKLQTPIFPDGIIYDRQNDAFRTPKVNFLRIAHLSTNPPQNEKGTDHHLDNQSLLAGYGGQVSNLFMDDLSKIAVLISEM